MHWRSSVIRLTVHRGRKSVKPVILLGVGILSLLCGIENQTDPRAMPTLSFDSRPEPNSTLPAIAIATPYPVPKYNPADYLPPAQAGKTVTVTGPNLSDKIQIAEDDPSVGT